MAKAAPAADAEGLAYPSGGAEDYARMKALDAPTLCYAKDAFTGACLIYEEGNVRPFYQLSAS